MKIRLDDFQPFVVRSLETTKDINNLLYPYAVASVLFLEICLLLSYDVV